MKSFLDRNYRFLRPLRPLYAWIKDPIVRRKTAAQTKKWKEKGFQDAKLDVCGGRNPYKLGEFLNVDIVSFPQVNLAFDITKRFPLPDGVISEVVSFATLEHLRKPHVDHVLKEFHRILKTGGLLRVSTPDIEAIAKGVLDGDDLDLINQQLFGKYKSDETEDLDLHKWMYPAGKMMEVLKKIGFTDVDQIPMEEGMHDPKYNYLIRARKS